MAAGYVTQLFNNVNSAATDLVANNLSQVIAFVTPWIALAMVIALTVEGLFIMMAPTGEPLTRLLKRFIWYAAIISFASAGGFYQTQLAQTALGLPNAIGQIFTVNGQTGGAAANGIAGTIDQTLANGLDVAAQAFDQGSIWTGNGLMSYAGALIVLIAVVLLCAIGTGLILMATFMLAITVCFGPIFIYALMFKATAGLFSRWIGSLINYILVSALLAVVFAFFIGMTSKLVQGLAAGNTGAQGLAAVAGLGLLTVASWLILFQVPAVAASWGGGVQASGAFLGSAVGGALGAAGAGGKAAAAGAAGGRAGAAAGAADGPMGAAGGAVGGAAGATARSVAGSAMRGLARGSRR